MLSKGACSEGFPAWLATSAVLALGLAGVASGARANDQRGAWSEPFDWPLIAIHAVLTPDGRVLSYGSSVTGEQGASSAYAVWNPADGNGPDSHLVFSNESGVDSFCSGQLLLPRSGEVITIGGNTLYGVTRFDYRDDGFVADGSLADARWYATLITLPDGRLLTQGGTTFRDTNRPHAITPGISDDGVTWRLLDGADSAEVYDGGPENRWWYPRSFVTPDGRVFGVTGSVLYYLDPDGEGGIEIAGVLEGESKGATSSAVMYRPGLILQVGGGDYGANDLQLPEPAGTANATIIDVRGVETVQSAASPMRYGRHWANTTLLPDGRVLVTGGSRANNMLRGIANVAEIWDPETDRWALGAEGRVARLYHSMALLLPDGRVLVAGGGAPGPLSNLNAEIYEPPYLFDGTSRNIARPSIDRAPAVLEVGRSFQVTVASRDIVDRVTLIKTGAVTHSFNMDQRFIELGFVQSGRILTISAPADHNQATPGYYMLFVLDEEGTPSIGRILTIEPEASIGGKG